MRTVLSATLAVAFSGLALAAPAPSAKLAAPTPLFPPIAQIMGPTDSPLPGYGKARDFDALIGDLHSADTQARRAAVTALGSDGNIRAVPYLGAVMLQLNEDLGIRVSAAMALGRIRNWRAATFLRQSLRDAAREVRFASALALGQSKGRDTVELLSGTLHNDSDWWVRFAAAVSLGDDRDPRAVEALAEAAQDDAEWQVRMQAVRSLGQIGSRDAARALARPLRDPDPSVRAATAMALSDIGGVDSISLLAGALHEETQDFPRRVISDGLQKLLAKP
jgi:HEAT repeat protein